MNAWQLAMSRAYATQVSRDDANCIETGMACAGVDDDLLALVRASTPSVKLGSISNC